MKRAHAKQLASHKPRSAQPPVPIETTGREIELSLDRDELLGLMQDSLESLGIKLGMLLVSSLLEDEVTRLCGPRRKRQPLRTHTRYGRPGWSEDPHRPSPRAAHRRRRRGPAGDLRPTPISRGHARGCAPPLLVLDGARALHAAAKRVWGQNGVIQRRQVHEKRNVKAHVPEKHHAELERRLSEAYHVTGYEAAKASLEATTRWLERINPDAASSLREGLVETLTVVRLGGPGACGGRWRRPIRSSRPSR